MPSGHSPEDADRIRAFHAWLDGELTPEESKRLEEKLHADAGLRADAEEILELESWMRETRAAAPGDMAGRVARAIAEERPAAAGRQRSGWRSLLEVLRTPWVWGPALAAAALAAVLLGRGPGPDASIPPAGPAAVADAAGETGQSSHEFRLAAVDAGSVCLVGGFNDWEVCATPLERNSDGTWSVTVDLPPGRYEYMFVVDGRWMTDPSAGQTVDDGFGNRNAVLFLDGSGA